MKPIPIGYNSRNYGSKDQNLLGLIRLNGFGQTDEEKNALQKLWTYNRWKLL
ncbi:hypothetical protein C943_04596 [Mariniradius saccharolyticus AK6]|uniref:Uncharacterized protein n=1 Tax=Mariniradius saccharolyticus AK6 TaxID=1239962 RepID=M7XZ07_9BACT|nr:hypothetical protein C943_04596 [Mariniradius saccharolyticus AK6]